MALLLAVLGGCVDLWLRHGALLPPTHPSPGHEQGTKSTLPRSLLLTRTALSPATARNTNLPT